MNVDHLVCMANQIGQFFEAQPDRPQALADLANHIARFWAPSMRRQLALHLAQGGAGLMPIVQEALRGQPGMSAD
jgi:formate dehydrogenase subunit delta